MNNPPRSKSPDYFRALYAADPDPWKFASSEYEQRKYKATLDAMTKQKYRRGFEVGCSIGVLTDLLAGRADALLAVDVDPVTLERANVRCAAHTHIDFTQMVIPRDWPDGAFDLIVLSEILYFLAPKDIVRAAELALQSLPQDGCIILVHWTGPTDYPCSGDEAADLFIAETGLTHTHRREQDYRLDVLTHRTPREVTSPTA